MTGYTGEKCPQSGNWQCTSHPSQVIPLAKGNTFPPCPNGGGHGATWRLIKAL